MLPKNLQGLGSSVTTVIIVDKVEFQRGGDGSCKDGGYRVG